MHMARSAPMVVRRLGEGPAGCVWQIVQSARLPQNKSRTVLTIQHILRLLNTNVKGQGKIMFALTEIKGVGRRYANLVCKKADIDMSKRYVLFCFVVGGLGVCDVFRDRTYGARWSKVYRAAATGLCGFRPGAAEAKLAPV